MKNNEFVEEKIKKTWEEVLEKDLYPNITEFSKMSGVSKSSIYHNYKEWAEKIKERRDQKHGKKEVSIMAKGVNGDNKFLKEQVKLLQQEVLSLRKENEYLSQQNTKKEEQLREKETIETKYELVLSGYDYLISQLQLAGVSQAKIKKIWQSFESNIVLK